MSAFANARGANPYLQTQVQSRTPLELVVMLDRNYGIKLKDPKEGRHVFQSIRTMAEYISKNRTQV